MTELDRRSFVLASAASLFLPSCQTARDRAIDAGRDLPRPSPAQLAWQEAELGVVFHWDLHVFDGKRYSQGRNRRSRIADPDELFQPTDYDIDQWFQSVTGMGARFAILTACHETGFRLWPSDANPYSTRTLSWRGGRGDVVGDFVAAARRHGVQPGIYFGARWNSHLGVLDFRVTEQSPVTQQEYNRLIEREVEEICSRYGPLFELWFDGGILAAPDGGPDVLPIIEKHQPDCLFYHSDERRDARWGGSESGTVPYPCWSTVDLDTIRTGPELGDKMKWLRHGDPDGPHWCPAMSDAPLRGAAGRHEWFWEPDDESAIYPVETLVDMYERSVGHNSTLIVGLTPDPRGRMPEADTERCREWGRALRDRYPAPLVRANGAGQALAVELPQPTTVSTVVLQEEIELGQRVREYVVQGLAANGQWQTLAEGTCIGHKRIQHVDPIEVSAVNVVARRVAAQPIWRTLACY